MRYTCSRCGEQCFDSFADADHYGAMYCDRCMKIIDALDAEDIYEMELYR